MDSLLSTNNTLNIYYYQMMGEMATESKDELASIGIQVGKDGKLIISQEISARTRHSGVVLNVLDKPFCADGTGRHNDTLAIRRVIDACPDGGTVLLPKGHTFYCGALFLKKSYDLSGRRNFICLR